MLSNAKETMERLKDAEAERMKDIYAGCDDKGLPKRFADNFYFRIIQSPLKHTQNIIALVENKNRYLSDAKKSIEQWRLYLEIMLDLSPQHEKADEWTRSLKLLEKYKF